MAKTIREECRGCARRGYIERQCCEMSDLEKITHELNVSDWDNLNSYQGYQVYRCRHCGALWGCRYQWDSGTGSDNRWAELDPENPRRHY